MSLSLTRPLVFFDIESTGIDASKDKIIDLSILKLYPNQQKRNSQLQNKSWYSNSCWRNKNSWNYRCRCKRLSPILCSCKRYF